LVVRCTIASRCSSSLTTKQKESNMLYVMLMDWWRASVKASKSVPYTGNFVHAVKLACATTYKKEQYLLGILWS